MHKLLGEVPLSNRYYQNNSFVWLHDDSPDRSLRKQKANDAKFKFYRSERNSAFLWKRTDETSHLARNSTSDRARRFKYRKVTIFFNNLKKRTT